MHLDQRQRPAVDLDDPLSLLAVADSHLRLSQRVRKREKVAIVNMNDAIKRL